LKLAAEARRTRLHFYCKIIQPVFPITAISSLIAANGGFRLPIQPTDCTLRNALSCRQRDFFSDGMFAPCRGSASARNRRAPSRGRQKSHPVLIVS
jgi:hypothetical protein